MIFNDGNLTSVQESYELSKSSTNINEQIYLKKNNEDSISSVFNK